jgi:cell division protein FtsN
MVDNSSDSGYELVLDNRRLIIAFVALVLFCGCFFVLGFVEGKRQGYQAGSLTAAESAAKPAAGEPKESGSQAAVADSGTSAVKEDAEKQPLNWYKNVSGREQKNEITPPPSQPAPALTKEAAKSAAIAEPAEPPPTPRKETAKPAAVSAPVAASGYTLQVGAFRQRQQAEVKAKLLRAKGFDCRIEVPQSSEDFYFLKVGRFKSRAQAVATQLRLKKNGFGSFIKTN